MTYREKIQDMIAKIHQIYDDAGELRDIATEQEKVFFNEIRRTFYSAAQPLQKLDDQLTDSRSAIVKPWFK